jgi:predicted O-methyltransferase YrrM
MAQLGTPMAIRVAATLRLGDHVTPAPRTPAELAEITGSDPDVLRRVLRHLAKRKIFEADEDGRYALTPLGQPLRSDHPSGVHEWLDIEGVGKAEIAFAQLLHSVRTGEAAYPAQFGRTMWEDHETDPEGAAKFNASMSVQVPQRAAELVSAYDWASVGHLIDLGGGAGTTMLALLKAFPTLRGTVLDRAEAAAAARDAFAAAGLSDRADAIAGSFLDPVPAAGGYLLSLVTHNWGDADVRTILRRCAEASGDETAVFVVENVGADGESPPTGMDLRMLVYCGGKERAASELDELGADAGLRVVGVHPAGTLSVVELRRAR